MYLLIYCPIYWPLALFLLFCLGSATGHRSHTPTSTTFQCSVKPTVTPFDKFFSFTEYSLQFSSYMAYLKFESNTRKFCMRLITGLLLCYCVGHVNAAYYHTDGNVSRNVPCRREANAAGAADDFLSNGICQDVDNPANGSLTIFPDFTRPLNFTGLFQAATCTDAKFPNRSKIVTVGSPSQGSAKY